MHGDLLPGCAMIGGGLDGAERGGVRAVPGFESLPLGITWNSSARKARRSELQRRHKGEKRGEVVHARAPKGVARPSLCVSRTARKDWF